MFDTSSDFNNHPTSAGNSLKKSDEEPESFIVCAIIYFLFEDRILSWLYT